MRREEIEQLERLGYRLAAAFDGRDWEEDPGAEEIARAESLGFRSRKASITLTLDAEGEVEDWQASSEAALEDVDTAFWRAAQRCA